MYKYISNSTWGMFVGASLQGIYYYDADYRHALFLQTCLNNNGVPKSADNIALLICLTALKEKKYMNIGYYNGNHLDNTANLFTLEGLAEPKN